MTIIKSYESDELISWVLHQKTWKIEKYNKLVRLRLQNNQLLLAADVKY